MEHKTVTIPERDLVALARIVHAAHDQTVSWRACACASCRRIQQMLPPSPPPPTAFYLLEVR